MQAAQQPSHVPDIGPLLMRSYLDERRKRLLYSDRGLHVLVCSMTPVVPLTDDPAHLKFIWYTTIN